MENTWLSMAKDHQPSVYNKVKAPQNQLSQELLSLRVQHKLSVQQVANMLDISVADYLDYEFGELFVKEQEYIKQITKLQKILNTK